MRTVGPHDENGDRHLDVKRAGAFGGALKEAMGGFREVSTGQAPIPRFVDGSALRRPPAWYTSRVWLPALSRAADEVRRLRGALPRCGS